MLITREMRWYPVENHANAVLMEIVNKIHYVLWRSVAARRGKIAADLIPPRAVEWVLHKWEELHMGKAQLCDIFG
jgi:hypothetical protein